MADGEVMIRSYRLCFELERRIHSIDRWRIPVPYGIPLRGVAYGAAALAAVLFLSRAPGFGGVLAVLHPALRLVILPIAVAYALTRMRVDGRPAHAAGISWGRWRLGAARQSVYGGAHQLGPRLLADVVVAVDDQAARYRRCLVRGPAEVTLRYPVTGRIGRRTIEVRGSGDVPLWRGKRLRLDQGQRLRVR